MATPATIERQTLVRLRSDGVEHVELSRFADGSAYVNGAGIESIYEQHPDAWQHALRDLDALGFVSLTAARDRGIVSLDWTPDDIKNRNA